MATASLRPSEVLAAHTQAGRDRRATALERRTAMTHATTPLPAPSWRPRHLGDAAEAFEQAAMLVRRGVYHLQQAGLVDDDELAGRARMHALGLDVLRRRVAALRKATR